ncbi:GNAT family N-acetyltransferase [Cohnella panacarvi]|uniref:GNAT family N-acetyltransferase n=1 Tax=Cohnella panacarvi TaxID=400776 RepID=UPI000478939D|nr:GNAT family N-acetyltransferase [Cohnella panacarvi]
MEIRYFRRSETELLQNAIHSVWAPNHVLGRNEQLLNYMFYENPAKHHWVDAEYYSFLGAWEDNKVVGLLGVMPFEVNNKGNTQVGCSLTNWIVPPEYRSTGAGYALFHTVKERNPEMILSLGINSTVAKLYKKMGWSILQDVPRWVGIVNKQKTVDKMLNGNERSLRFWDELKTYQYNSEYQIFDYIDEQWDQFYEQSFAPKTIGFSRNFQFIKWRYINHPAFNYNIITCKDGNNNIRGMAIIRIESVLNNCEKIGRIVEFIAVDQDSSVSLANAVAEKAKDCLFLDFYCFSSISTWGLEAIGFKKILASENDPVVVPTRFQPIDLTITNMMAAFSIQSDIKNKINLAEESCFYITKGDSDQDRPN